MTVENDRDKAASRNTDHNGLTSMKQQPEPQEHGTQGRKWESRKEDYRVRTGIHAIAEKHGYRISETDGDIITFTHSNGASLQTERAGDGRWTHTDSNGETRSGCGGEELIQVLSK